MRRWRFVLSIASILGFGLVGIPACVGDAPGSGDAGNMDGTNTTGKYKGPCYPNSTCDTGLVCVQGAICLMPGEDAAGIDTGTETGGEAGGDSATCKKPAELCGMNDCCPQDYSCMSSNGQSVCCSPKPGHPCSTPNECCDYLQNQMKCDPNGGCCVGLGGNCMTNQSDCCPNLACANGKCCAKQGQPCMSASDCCSGNCNSFCQ